MHAEWSGGEITETSHRIEWEKLTLLSAEYNGALTGTE